MAYLFCVAIDKIRPATSAETLAYVYSRKQDDPLSTDFEITREQQNVIDLSELETIEEIDDDSTPETDPVPGPSTAPTTGEPSAPVTIESSDDEPIPVIRSRTETEEQPESEGIPPSDLLMEGEESEDAEEIERKKRQREHFDLPQAQKVRKAPKVIYPSVPKASSSSSSSSQYTIH